MPKVSITSDSSTFFIYGFKQKAKRVPKVMLVGYFSHCGISFKVSIKGGCPYNFTSVQKCLTNDFFNLETITSCHYIHHITLHKSLVSLAVTNLK